MGILNCDMFVYLFLSDPACVQGMAGVYHPLSARGTERRRDENATAGLPTE